MWHCSDGTLIKVGSGGAERSETLPDTFCCSGAAPAPVQVHRHHLGLRWPDGDPRLASRPLVVHVDTPLEEHGGGEDLFACFSRLNGHIFSRMRDVEFDP